MSGRDWTTLAELVMLRMDEQGELSPGEPGPYLVEVPHIPASLSRGQERRGDATEQVSRLYATQDQRVTDRLPPLPEEPRAITADDLLGVGLQSSARVLYLGKHKRTVLGRGTDCQVFVSDGKVSRQHAAIERVDEDRWAIVDLRSSNGTRLQGRRLAPQLPVVLEDEQVIQLGDWRCLVLSSSRLDDILFRLQRSSDEPD